MMCPDSRPDFGVIVVGAGGAGLAAALSAAEAGASLADLMRRLGHSSMVAAKRYLHATDSRDRQIADALSELAATSGSLSLN